MTKSNTALRADDDPVLAAIELTANAWQRFVTSCAREPKDTNGKVTPAYARWQADQDDICQDWDGAYTLMLATPPTTAVGAAALIGAFLRYERALGTELENFAPLLQTLLAYLEGCEAANCSGIERSAHQKRNARGVRQQRTSSWPCEEK
jgi:hypothetical protein